jgi:hypothetical protein
VVADLVGTEEEVSETGVAEAEEEVAEVTEAEEAVVVAEAVHLATTEVVLPSKVKE